jgi:hypothetical protein
LKGEPVLDHSENELQSRLWRVINLFTCLAKRPREKYNSENQNNDFAVSYIDRWLRNGNYELGLWAIKLL